MLSSGYDAVTLVRTIAYLNRQTVMTLFAREDVI